jgi:hypothetical protein
LNLLNGELVDMYSGAKILKEKPKGSYYLIADKFSISKLNKRQEEFFYMLIEDCEKAYFANDLIIFRCE